MDEAPKAGAQKSSTDISNEDNVEGAEAKVKEEDLSTVLANENHLEDPGHTIFHNVAFLGSVVVHNPKDEVAIQQHMAVMNSRRTLC